MFGSDSVAYGDDEGGRPRGVFASATSSLTTITTSTTFMCDINCNYYHYYQVPVQWSSLISLRLSALLFLPSFAGVFPFYLLPFYSVLNLAAVSVSQWLLCAMVEHT